MTTGTSISARLTLETAPRTRPHIRPEEQPDRRPEWTLAALFFVDNDLSGPAREDLASVRDTGAPAGTVVAVETDSVHAPGVRVRHEIRNLPAGMDIIPHKVPANQLKRDALGSFVGWARTQVPDSEHLLLDIRGHGDGFGIEADSNTFLYLADVSRHIRQALDSEKGREAMVDILAFEACFMGSLEAALEFSRVARFMLASQVEEPAAGWPYAEMLRAVKSSMTPEVLAKALVDTYRENARNKLCSTLAAIRLGSDVEAAAQTAHELGRLLAADWDKDKVGEAVIEARRGTLEFGRRDFVDLEDFMTKLESELTGSPNGGPGKMLAAQAAAVADAVRKCVVSDCPTRECCENKKKSCKFPAPRDADDRVHCAHGLSIWFPRMREIYRKDDGASSFKKKLYLETSFAKADKAAGGEEKPPKESGWVTLLDRYHKDPRTGAQSA